MKHFFLLFTALVATTALWAYDYDFIVDGVAYNITDAQNRHVEVTALGTYSGSITLYNSVSYNSKIYSVTSIGDKAFEDCTSLKAISIPYRIKTIGERAFCNCSSLKTISLPSTMTSIGCRAFDGCSSLPVVNNLRYAGTYLVEAVDRTLSTYTIKKGTKWIGDYAFLYSTSLKTITIPNSVISIGKAAFSGCTSLQDVIVSDSVTTIGEGAFYNCCSILSITIPNSVTSIGEDAFLLVNNVAYFGTATGSPWGSKCVNGYIDGYWVYDDQTKTKLCGGSQKNSGFITIPDGVTIIGEKAFYGYTSFISLTIPKSVNNIARLAFSGCTSLKSITCYAHTPPMCSSLSFDGVSTSIPLFVPSESKNAYKNATGWKKFTNIHTIEDSALPQLTDSPSDRFTKIIKNGQLLILRDGKTYNVQGAEL